MPGTLGRWQEAADFFEKAAEAQPDRLDARLGLGIALLHLEKSDAAAENFEKVLEQQPDHTTALFGKAVTLQLQWNFDEAARIYQSILAGKPDFEECLINLVTIGMARKDQAMIADYSEKLLKLRPNSQTALEGLATCAFASGDYRSRPALLHQAHRIHARKLRSLVQPGRCRNRKPATWTRPPKPIRRPSASAPTPARPT